MEDNNVKEKKHFFHKKEKKTEVAEVPKKKKKVWLIVLIIAAIVIVLIGSAVKNMTSQIETAANMVEVEPVEKRDLSDSVSLKGTIAGQSKTNVMSLAAAEITAVNVQVGDIVKEGDPLVTLDQKDIEKQIAELKTNINNANASQQMMLYRNRTVLPRTNRISRMHWMQHRRRSIKHRLMLINIRKRYQSVRIIFII